MSLKETSFTKELKDFEPTDEERKEVYKLKEKPLHIRQLRVSQIFRIVSENMLTDDFKSSRQALITLVSVPFLIRVYFWKAKRQRYMKGALFYGALGGGYFYANSCITKDVHEFIQRDEIKANILRDLIVEEAAVTQLYPDYSQTIYKIQREREQKAKETSSSPA